MLIPKSPGPVDRNNLESLKAHHAFTDQLCKLNFRLTLSVVVIALCYLAIVYYYSDMPGLQLPMKAINIMLPLVTVLLILVQSFVIFMRRSFKHLIDEFPPK